MMGISFTEMFVGAAGVGLLGVGAIALAQPEFAGTCYGIEAEDESGLAFMRAMAVRDLALGVLTILARKHPRTTLATLGCIAAFDCISVATTTPEPPLAPVAIHGSSVVVLFLAAMRLR